MIRDWPKRVKWLGQYDNKAPADGIVCGSAEGSATANITSWPTFNGPCCYAWLSQRPSDENGVLTAHTSRDVTRHAANSDSCTSEFITSYSMAKI